MRPSVGQIDGIARAPLTVGQVKGDLAVAGKAFRGLGLHGLQRSFQRRFLDLYGFGVKLTAESGQVCRLRPADAFFVLDKAGIHPQHLAQLAVGALGHFQVGHALFHLVGNMGHFRAQYRVIGLGDVIIEMSAGHVTGPDGKHRPGRAEGEQQKHWEVKTQGRHAVVRDNEHAHRFCRVLQETSKRSKPHIYIL